MNQRLPFFRPTWIGYGSMFSGALVAIYGFVNIAAYFKTRAAIPPLLGEARMAFSTSLACGIGGMAIFWLGFFVKDFKRWVRYYFEHPNDPPPRFTAFQWAMLMLAATGVLIVGTTGLILANMGNGQVLPLMTFATAIFGFIQLRYKADHDRLVAAEDRRQRAEQSDRLTVEGTRHARAAYEVGVEAVKIANNTNEKIQSIGVQIRDEARAERDKTPCESVD